MTSLKFGRKAKRDDRFKRTLSFGDYVSSELAYPVSTNNLGKVYEKLKISNISELFPMDGNDTYGDCTIAGLAHYITLMNGFCSNSVIPSQGDVINLYLTLSGGADSGLDMLQVMNYVRQNSFLREKPILAYVEVNPKNLVHMKQAISIFGSLYIGFRVQQNAIKDFRNGKPWTPGVLTNDGHCVLLVDYDATDFTALTWGSTEKGTYGWESECVDEVFCMIPAEAQDIRWDGFDMAQLQGDLKLVTS